MKTLILKIYPTVYQKNKLDEFINTARYIYNKTNEHIKKGEKINFQNLRDKLVTQNTKKYNDEYKKFQEQIKECNKDKDKIKNLQIECRNEMKKYKSEKNKLVNLFEINTPKDIRANAVKQCCDAYKSAFSNFKNGNIKYFNIEFRKRKSPVQTIELASNNIQIEDNKIKILPKYFNNDCYFMISKNNRKKLKNITIKNNVDIVRKNKKDYYLHISIPIKINKSENNKNVFTSIDLGVRTFATVHQNTKSSISMIEYYHRRELLLKLNAKIDALKLKKYKYRYKNKKKYYLKIEKQKKNAIDCLHWDFINDILKNNDIIYIGDIKSHNIVKTNKNNYLNREINDLKFYILKQRLLYKASLINGKIVKYINESYTTKTCSCCGTINNNIKNNKIFNCSNCSLVTDRDMNASKNIKMKGLLI